MCIRFVLTFGFHFAMTFVFRNVTECYLTWNCKLWLTPDIVKNVTMWQATSPGISFAHTSQNSATKILYHNENIRMGPRDVKI